MEDKDEKALNFINSIKNLGELPPMEGVTSMPQGAEEMKVWLAEQTKRIAKPELRIALVLDPMSGMAKFSFLTAYMIAKKFGVEGLEEYMQYTGIPELVDLSKL